MPKLEKRPTHHTRAWGPRTARRRSHRLDAGHIEVGGAADLLLVEAPLGSAGDTWAAALEANPSAALVTTAR